MGVGGGQASGVGNVVGEPDGWMNYFERLRRGGLWIFEETGIMGVQ